MKKPAAKAPKVESNEAAAFMAAGSSSESTPANQEPGAKELSSGKTKRKYGGKRVPEAKQESRPPFNYNQPDLILAANTLFGGEEPKVPSSLEDAFERVALNSNQEPLFPWMKYGIE